MKLSKLLQTQFLAASGKRLLSGQSGSCSPSIAGEPQVTVSYNTSCTSQQLLNIKNQNCDPNQGAQKRVRLWVQRSYFYFYLILSLFS